ncbi:MOSC domain-containing protein [Actinoallomurus acaciae]|uniref:MOSC domain-containing protein n=1 Tax=Actinoallomurus acaciae TaxID=502577 RepID=A0ABV5YAE0_9ACTN
MSASPWREIGRVTRVSRYPLKGTQGEDLDRARIGWHGLAGDRQYALLRHGDQSGLPREFPALVAWRVTMPQPGHLHIKLPDGTSWEMAPDDARTRRQISERASADLGEPVSLVQLWRGTFDSMPISVISAATVTALAAEPAFDPRRLRANLTIELDDPRPGVEQEWLRRDLRLGDGPDGAVLRIDRTTTRCEAVDVDPETGSRDREIFEQVRRDRKNRIGVYASVRHPGTVSAGAAVFLR